MNCFMLFGRVVSSKSTNFSRTFIVGCDIFRKLFQLSNDRRFSSALTVMKYLKPFKFDKYQVYDHPKLFELSAKDLKEKSRYLVDKVQEEDDVLRLLTLSKKDIDKYFQIKNDNQRILELASIAQCSESEACHILVKYPFLLRSKMATVKEKIHIMLEGGILMEDIKRDLWILTYTRDHIRQRLEVIHELNICPIKPWMIRCPQQVLLRAKSNKEENLQAMAPHHSSEDYLCSRLRLSRSEYNRFADKYPAAARVQVSKLKELIDFLLYKGFTTQQIAKAPRILCHSVFTIKDRLETLKKLNHTPQSLSLICKSQKIFNAFVTKLKETPT